MRPLFAVQLLAGVTCVLTLLFAVGNLYAGVVAANGMNRYSFREEAELREWREAHERAMGNGMSCLTLSLLQGAILVFVSKHKKQLASTGIPLAETAVSALKTEPVRVGV